MPVITRDYYLELNAVPLATPAWEILDLSPLLDDAPLAGSNRQIPDGPTVPYPMFPDDQVITLLLEVYGDFDQEGVAASGGLAGMLENWDYLKAGLGYALATGDGTVPAIFHRDAAVALTVDVHFLGFKGSATFGAEAILTTFDIRLPAGFTWEPVGS